MKLINTSNKPFEFTYNGGHYGPYKPGEIVDFSDENMGMHALRKSAILEQDSEAVNVGEIIGYQMEILDNVPRERKKELVSYQCSLAMSGLCDAKPFKTMAELKAHMDTHFELAPEPVAVKPVTAPVPNQARK